METPQGALELHELVLPALANHHGTLFAGQALLLMAKAAYLAARRHARNDIVMAGVKSVDFLRPVPVGQTLTLSAWIAESGRSSMTVRVTAHAATPEGPATLALQGEFAMVAIGAGGQPVRFNSDKPHKETPA